MKTEKFLNALNDIDGQFIREAHEEKAQPRRAGHRRFGVLIAAVVALMALTVTAFAAEDIAGWFRNYFASQSETDLTPGQIEYIEENEQIILETQENSGYSLNLKSVLSDGNLTYITLGVTAPADVTADDLDDLSCMGIDLYDQNKQPCSSYTMEKRDDGDGLDNTVDLVFAMEPGIWNAGGSWTLRFSRLVKRVHDEAYERELLETKYTGMTDFMFTDEEASRIYQEIVLAEGDWVFTFDLNNDETQQLELIADPVTTQSCYGYKPDGTEVFEEVEITSFILRPMSAVISAESAWGALEFSDNSSRPVYVVMKDGSRIQLYTSYGAPNEAHLTAESPIVLEEVDHVLLADGTKLMAP